MSEEGGFVKEKTITMIGHSVFLESQSIGSCVGGKSVRP